MFMIHVIVLQQGCVCYVTKECINVVGALGTWLSRMTSFVIIHVT
jgi:hypothetical protein